jgi:lyso-ornithine lipid O-acyltransferase
MPQSGEIASHRPGQYQPGHLAGRPRLFRRADRSDSQPGWPVEGRPVTRRVRAVCRGVAIMLWTIPCAVVQSVLLALPGRAKVTFARVYWAGVSRLLGIRIRLIGTVAPAASGRPIIFVCNHSSWIDVPTLGGILDACFVAKGDVATWPIVRTIAWLGRTVFVTRQRGSTRQERDAMRARLADGDNLILFPEGTSSDGSRVLAFRTAFFSVADPLPGGAAPMIQPVSVVYDRVGGLPAGRASRPVFAWYGDMDIASHFWRLAQHTGLRATVLLHAPVDPGGFADRKQLARSVWQTVADGAATLRQNRPARPLAVAEAAHATVASGAPALA